jgi:hypothetical protein
MRLGAIVCLIVGIVVWVIGVIFVVFFGTFVEGTTPGWMELPPPDCFIGAQMVILAMFLPMIVFAIIGSALVLPGLSALLRR